MYCNHHVGPQTSWTVRNHQNRLWYPILIQLKVLLQECLQWRLPSRHQLTNLFERFDSPHEMCENVSAKVPSIFGLTNTLSIVVCAVQPCKLPLTGSSWAIGNCVDHQSLGGFFLCLPHCASRPALHRNMGVDGLLWVLSASQNPFKFLIVWLGVKELSKNWSVPRIFLVGCLLSHQYGLFTVIFAKKNTGGFSLRDTGNRNVVSQKNPNQNSVCFLTSKESIWHNKTLFIFFWSQFMRTKAHTSAASWWWWW